MSLWQTAPIWWERSEVSQERVCNPGGHHHGQQSSVPSPKGLRSSLSPGGRELGVSTPASISHCLLLLFSRSVVANSVTPWTATCPAPLSTGLSRQEYRSGLPFPPPGDLPDPGIEATSPARAGRFFTTEPPGKPVSPWLGHNSPALLADRSTDSTGPMARTSLPPPRPTPPHALGKETRGKQSLLHAYLSHRSRER